MYTNKSTDEPQMDPPSREAMEGKLQIYADGFAMERMDGRDELPLIRRSEQNL
jgi:hypothetical protein